MPKHEGNILGRYLQDRRRRADPLAADHGSGRRRTPGLRREEVARHARVSPTWYTWLEQGRGGSPSAEALDRIADALRLTTAERDHLFTLAERRRPVTACYRSPDAVTPALRQVLDGLGTSPAFVKTAASDLVAWNRAATLVFADFAQLPPGERNLLRMHFMDGRLRSRVLDWDEDARLAVARFRLEAARAGAGGRIAEVVEALARDSPEFRALWEGSDVSIHGEGVKRLRHEAAGLLSLTYSAFVVDGQPDMKLVVYSPATEHDLVRIRALADAHGGDQEAESPVASSRVMSIPL